MENTEIWKDIQGYEGMYMISNMGNVKSLNYNKTGKERILKQTICKGYCQVGLHKDGKKKKYLVHRLVAIHFIPNPNNLLEVNHKDEVKTNNVVSNLEFCDRKYNINYGTRKEKFSNAMKGKKQSQEHIEKRTKAQKGKILSQETKEKIRKAHKGMKHTQESKEKMSKTHQKPILQFNREGTKILGKWESAKQVERELNIFATNIAQCCKGKLKSVKGFKWLYLEDYVNRMEKLYNMVLKKAS